LRVGHSREAVEVQVQQDGASFVTGVVLHL